MSTSPAKQKKMGRVTYCTREGFDKVVERLKELSNENVQHTLLQSDGTPMTAEAWCTHVPALTRNSKVWVGTTTTDGAHQPRGTTISNLLMYKRLTNRGCATELQCLALTDEDATARAESEGLMLVRARNATGFWLVKEERRSGKSPRPFFVKDGLDRVCRNRPKQYFASAPACALAIARALGRDLSRTFALGYPERTRSDVLGSLRAPTMVARKEQPDRPPDTCVRCLEPTQHGNSWCSACYRAGYRSYIDTWRGQTAYDLKKFKERTLERNCELCYCRPGRKRRLTSREHDMPEWRDTTAFRHWVADALERQRFSCAYSGLELTPRTFSVERVDEQRGYSTANCVLIDIHFQSAWRQWSREKFTMVPILRDTPCTWYGTEELLARFRLAVYGSEQRTKVRNASGRGHTHDITKHDLLEMWRRQGGRCAYLGVPLTLQGDWQFSVERLDDSVGYVKENVVLIALEVQNGHCKWTRAFADEVWGEREPERRSD